ncbi:hypothetical protein CAXC1_180016 [Candidatus Xenohaliotis californiensis]|uniref:Uncharacterized protein n=1 Tax=Candidatus Xenohaliotis californiensis TaxID=84677 RepID=A0ABP0ES15_9RICK|nr:hypothetical protein CAXC1_180016 [Candidatus Xenohaliotis californiensis]
MIINNKFSTILYNPTNIEGSSPKKFRENEYENIDITGNQINTPENSQERESIFGTIGDMRQKVDDIERANVEVGTDADNIYATVNKSKAVNKPVFNHSDQEEHTINPEAQNPPPIPERRYKDVGMFRRFLTAVTNVISKPFVFLYNMFSNSDNKDMQSMVSGRAEMTDNDLYQTSQETTKNTRRSVQDKAEMTDNDLYQTSQETTKNTRRSVQDKAEMADNAIYESYDGLHGNTRRASDNVSNYASIDFSGARVNGDLPQKHSSDYSSVIIGNQGKPQVVSVSNGRTDVTNANKAQADMYKAAQDRVLQEKKELTKGEDAVYENAPITQQTQNNTKSTFAQKVQEERKQNLSEQSISRK